MSRTVTGKCQHEHLIVHSTVPGTWFHAQCRDCGMKGPDSTSPHSANARFNKKLGERNPDEDDEES